MGLARGGGKVLGETGYEIKLFANSSLNMIRFLLGRLHQILDFNYPVLWVNVLPACIFMHHVNVWHSRLS